MNHGRRSAASAFFNSLLDAPVGRISMLSLVLESLLNIDQFPRPFHESARTASLDDLPENQGQAPKRPQRGVCCAEAAKLGPTETGVCSSGPPLALEYPSAGRTKSPAPKVFHSPAKKSAYTENHRGNDQPQPLFLLTNFTLVGPYRKQWLSA